MRYAVIMAGGTGTRFWPESREDMPKQLLRIGSEQTLLTQTVGRIQSIIPLPQVMVITSENIAEKIANEMSGLLTENLITEPLRRNTGPCVLLAAKLLLDRDPKALLVVLAADHLIQREDLFRQIIAAAMDLAGERDVLLTLGIPPTYPEIGYGYIECGENAGTLNGLPYYRVAAFHEKPSLETAQHYFTANRFLWNSGMFVFSAKSLWKKAAQHLPQLTAKLAAVDGLQSPARIKEQIDHIYPQLEAVSLDKGLMEKADNILVFPADIGWNDVGSWTTLRQIFPPDADGNVALGECISLHSHGNTVFAREGIVVTLGVDDMIIVHTPDATLVARRDDAQGVKHIFEELEKRGWKKYL